MKELSETVGYCGLACGVCVHRCQPDCRGGGGARDCHQRNCCRDKGLSGCWECEEFPCDRGFLAKVPDPAWRGICIGCVQFIRERGLEEYAARIVTRLADRMFIICPPVVGISVLLLVIRMLLGRRSL